jgi:hypothetical protein
MLLYDEKDERAKTGGLDPNPHKGDCLLCSEKLNYPIIYWMGDPPIYFHAECCRSICIRLLRDVWEWECKSGDAK